EGAPPIHGFGHATAPDTLALFAWLFQKDMVRALEREIDQCADDEHAITDDKRAGAVAELLRAILSAERDEAAFAEQVGEGADERPEIDPRAWLRLAEDLPPPRA